jgi:hypothetical protein
VERKTKEALPGPLLMVIVQKRRGAISIFLEITLLMPKQMDFRKLCSKICYNMQDVSIKA